MNEKLISKMKLKKGLFILGGVILATNLSYSAPVTDQVGVEFTIHDNLIINTTTTNLDFGNVAIIPGKIDAPKDAVLTIEGNDFAKQSVSVTVPKELGLIDATNGNSSIAFTSKLDGSNGSVATNGNDLIWTSDSGFTSGQSKFTVNFGGSIDLSGTETAGDYQEIATINVAYN